MKDIKIKCKFISPAFLYGSGKKAEMRATSIKGLMRFWWRASYNNYQNLTDMKKEEIKIFGGQYTDDKNETVAVKSKISVLAELGDSEAKQITNLNLSNAKSGLEYLFYSMNIEDNKDKFHFEPNTKFTVTFRFAEENKDYLKDYLKAFNILQLFGGIGGRSRRGAGSFIVIEATGKGYEDLIEKYLYTENSNEDIKDAYKEIFSKIKPGKNLKKVDFSNIFSEECEAYLYYGIEKQPAKINPESPFYALKDLKVFDYIDCLNIIGEKYKAIKSSKQNSRGQSPLIIKPVKDGNECKVLILKLGGKFNNNAPADKLIEECESEKSDKIHFLNLKEE